MTSLRRPLPANVFLAYWRYLFAPTVSSGSSPPPATERITNGGFETGDLTGYDSGFGSVTAAQAHSGTYSYEMVYADLLKQTLGTAIDGSKITTAKFSGYGIDVLGNHSRVGAIIHYTDTTQDNHVFTLNNGAWTECDFLPYIDPTKTVDYVTLQNVDDTAWDCFVDDLSLLATS